MRIVRKQFPRSVLFVEKSDQDMCSIVRPQNDLQERGGHTGLAFSRSTDNLDVLLVETDQQRRIERLCERAPDVNLVAIRLDVSDDLIHAVARNTRNVG